jgi:sugar (pentulose or hexulose) kinase
MLEPLVLTVDLGTQSVRAMLTDRTGGILHKVQHKFEIPYHSKSPGWAEQKPEVYWDAVCGITTRLKTEAEDVWGDIIAVTVTTIRDTCLCVDRDGKPLRDAILWLDKRECVPVKPVPLKNMLLFSMIGMKDTVELQRKVSACNWIIANEPGIWAKTDKFIMISGWLTFMLTGKLVDSVGNMIGHIPFNSKTRTWMKKNELTRCVFDIENEKLTALLEPGEILGCITGEASRRTGIPEGLPLIATGSDKGCETLGLSCVAPDCASIGLGTTATIQFTIGRYMEPLPFIPAYPAVMKNHYNPEVQVYRGYWLISWFKKEFAAKEVLEAEARGIAPEELLNARLAEIPAGCNGLVFQPYFTPGVVMPKARGAIVGFSDIHTRAHIYRAIIEGINFALMDGLKTMERRGKVKINKLFIAGGGSQSDEICRITANMFGLPVYRIQTYEAAGLGSAVVAFAAMGVYKSVKEAVAAMVHVKDEFLPDLREHEKYQAIYDGVFCKIFGRLLPLYKRNEA